MCVGTTYRKSHEIATYVYVARQIRIDDCGVYGCMFADLINQRIQIGEAEHGWVPEDKTALRKPKYCAAIPPYNNRGTHENTSRRLQCPHRYNQSTYSRYSGVSTA